jgi:hypothetical protein
MVKITLVFNFVTRGIWKKDREGVGLQIYESGLIIDDTHGPETDEPIIYVFFAICVNQLGFDTRD